MNFLISLIFFSFFSRSSNNVTALINNDDQKILSVQCRDLEYLDNSFSPSFDFSKFINSAAILGGEFVYSDQNDQDTKQLRGVCFDTNTIFFVGVPYVLKENNNFFQWGKRTNNVFFLNSYKQDRLFDYALLCKDDKEFQIFSLESKKIYREIITKHTIKLHDSFLGLDVQCSDLINQSDWRKYFVFGINYNNERYFFRYLVDKDAICFFYDDTKKLDLPDLEYLSDKNIFFYFGSKRFVVDKPNNTISLLLKTSDGQKTIGTIFLGLYLQDFEKLLKEINNSHALERSVDSLIEIFENRLKQIRWKIILMTCFFKIKHHLNLLFQHYLKKLY